jgi:hypothetical protein
MTSVLRVKAGQRLFHLSRVAPQVAPHYRFKSMASRFTLPNSDPPCDIRLCEGLTQDELMNHKPFKQWLETLQKNLKTQWNQNHEFYNDPYQLWLIEIQAIDRFGKDRIGFIKFKADVTTTDGEYLPGAVFLRGGSVAMLVSHSQQRSRISFLMI